MKVSFGEKTSFMTWVNPNDQEEEVKNEEEV